MSIRQKRLHRLTQGFGNMAGVTRPPSAKKRQTHIGNDADAPSEVLGDEFTNSGEDKHLMQLAADDDVEMSDLLDAADYIRQSQAGWAQYDPETKQFY